MNPDNRIATRYLFEAQIVVRFLRENRNMSAHGWVRDLSESGLAAFVADELTVGEDVTLLFSFSFSSATGKEEIPARVARRLGTQYGFQFVALSQQQRAAIRAILRGEPANGCSGRTCPSR